MSPHTKAKATILSLSTGVASFAFIEVAIFSRWGSDLNYKAVVQAAILGFVAGISALVAS